MSDSELSDAPSLDEGERSKYQLWTYEADPDNWEHMKEAYWKKRRHDRTQFNTAEYDFEDWVLHLVKLPPKGLNIQRRDTDYFHCLECGFEIESEDAIKCGPGCWKRFQEAMKKYDEPIKILSDPVTGQGAWLAKGELDGRSDPQEPCNDPYIGMYIGDIYPEHPRYKWAQSDYVLPVNGEDWNIEEFRTTHFFTPRYGGPTRPAQPNEPRNALTSRGTRKRNQGGTPEFVPSAYDTETYGVMVDAEKKGNWTRFVNSRCDPNLEAISEQVGKVRLTVFRPIRKIPAGEELTFYYGKGFFEEHQIQCRCSCAQDQAGHEPGTYSPENIRSTDIKGGKLPPGLQEARSRSRSPPMDRPSKRKRDETAEGERPDEELFDKTKKKLKTKHDADEQQD